MNWKAYWTSYPRGFDKRDYLRQVKRTRGGQPVPEAEIEASIAEICDRLRLTQNDVLLDLCCGNGLLTQALARSCRRVVGVDFSEPLITIADAYHRPANVMYVYMNALEVGGLGELVAEPFTKVVMIFALQHFRKGDLPMLLRGCRSVLSDSGEILFAAVPDRSRKGTFYNTIPRRLRLLWDQLTGRDQLGTWWDKNEIADVCRGLGLQCEFFPGSVETGFPYRFDVKISPMHE